MCKNDMKKLILLLALMAFTESYAKAITVPTEKTTVTTDRLRVSRRPDAEARLFVADAIEQKIREVQELLKDAPYLAWMFTNCFPNTLDTTVHYTVTDEGDDDTFVYTGDIHAMWLRDSGAQVWPYVQFAQKNEKIRRMIRGTILRQLKSIVLDPYANAFNMGLTGSEWASDHTDMKPFLHERKYEIDSLFYVAFQIFGSFLFLINVVNQLRNYSAINLSCPKYHSSSRQRITIP